MDDKQRHILGVDDRELNQLIVDMLKEKMSNSSTRQVQAWIRTAAKSLEGAIKEGIKEALVELGRPIVDRHLACTPDERYVDVLLIYDALSYMSETRFTDNWRRFLGIHAKDNYYTPTEQNHSYRNGVVLRFEEPVRDRDAASIMDTEGFWLMHNNTRYMVYDGNACMNPAVRRRLTHKEGLSGVMVTTNLISYEEAWKTAGRWDLEKLFKKRGAKNARPGTLSDLYLRY
ncbi:hypothetical protein GF351_03475, partial [Candidatus Woesearchaeota archaeon]|nr:hypothetical protein [Candidatus Woesearchaeota archaeon]